MNTSISSQTQTIWISCIFLVVAPLLVVVSYSNTLSAPFVFDDQQNIVHNPNIRMTELSLSSLTRTLSDNPTPRPIAYLSFGLNHWWSGYDVAGFRVANIFIHLLNGWLVFWLSVLIQRHLVPEDGNNPKFSKTSGIWIGFATATLFLVHPVQTQSVTYIVQRMASLCALFYLAALILYLVGRHSPNRRTKIGSWCGCFLFWILAIGVKQLAVTLPLAILLCEWILFQRGDRRWLIRNSKYLISIAALMLIVAFLFKGTELPKLFTRGYTKRDFTLWERLYTEGRVILHYLTLVVAPTPGRLTLIYDFPISRSLLNPVTTLFAWGLIVAVVGWGVDLGPPVPVSVLGDPMVFSSPGC